MRWLAVVAVALLMTACTPAFLKGNADMRARQVQREQQLAGKDHFTLHAHLGVTDGEHGGSGNLTWKRDGDQLRFTVRAPITGRSFRLIAGPDGARLEGLDEGTVYGRDAQQLLQRVMGWHIPVQPLHDWVRGLRAPADKAAATLRFNEDGLPSRLKQDGWTVEYHSWFSDRDPPLPRKVYATYGDYRVKLSIHAWSGT